MIVHKIIPLFVIFTATVFSSPSSYQPVMIIDCKKNGSVFEESCFKNIQFVTGRLRDSGSFEDVVSISNVSFLYRKEGQVYPVTFSDQSLFKNRSFRKLIFGQYESEMSIFSDKNQRFALIYSSALNLNGKDCNVCKELKDTMNYSKVPVIFYYEKQFNEIGVKNLIKKTIRIQLKYPVTTSLENIQSFYTLYNFQQDLYKMPGIKLVYSAVNIYSFISSVLLFGQNQAVAQENWMRVLPLWEICGNRRSGYLDLKNNEMYVDVYTAWNSIHLSENIQKVARQRLAGTGVQWNILEDSGITTQKTDDGQLKNISLVHDQESRAEKSSPEKINKKGENLRTSGMPQTSH